VLPCLLFEDEHLLVVNKPAGLNTHAPSPFAGEGLYDWLRHREPRWARLAIIHRLDKETSGVMVFSKTPLANRSLTEQFAQRRVGKTYLLLTDRAVPAKELVVKSSLVRVGEKYVSRPLRGGGEPAETQFRPVTAAEAETGGAEARGQEPKLSRGRGESACQALLAYPLTGRTHQIRVHAAQAGFPILCDTLYGGSLAARVCLHASTLTLRHPASGEPMTWSAPVDFTADARGLLRTALIDPERTNAYRLIHGASDGWPGWYVDRLGDYLLSQGAQPATAAQTEELERLAQKLLARGAYHKLLTRQVGKVSGLEGAPQLVLGEPAPAHFSIRENGVPFELRLAEGYSAGLFLDQRDNRRRLLTGYVAADFPLLRSLSEGQAASFRVLNAFSYTCGFSVCAARGGACATSLDLSRKYLEWGKSNFALSQMDPAAHEFIVGDVLDWLRRLAKRPRLFEVVLLDPPTFSRSKLSGVFRAEKDYGKLVQAAAPLLAPGGVLFASTNAAGWAPEAFLAVVKAAIHSAGRRIVHEHYVPQPPDCPIARAEPAYLKTVWLRLSQPAESGYLERHGGHPAH
jgi:23S rRNA (cytosine1962-C5)-methyltransferase